MKMVKNKIAAIVISMLMITVIGASTALSTAHGQINIPTISFCNVAPNPCGVGQTVTVNFWLAVPLASSEVATNMTIKVTTPAGTTSTLGPFTSDLTGGTFTTYTPSSLGNYTFQLIYGGQYYKVPPYTGDYNEPSVSAPTTLVVTSTPRGGLADTPLPTNYWEAPVSAENVQLWAGISGGWMGYVANTFANTGGYNASGNYNPYTMAPASAHILWTKPWCVGGAAGGPLGNNEQSSSYWTTSQYDPKYAPIIMDGIEYSTWYTTQTGSSQGIMAFNLYTGQTLWVINTTYALKAGMIINFPTIDQYGCVGPYIFATDGGGFFSPTTTWYMYDGLTGQYVAKVSNAPSFALMGADANGNIIGYAVATNASFFGPTNPTLTVQIPNVNGNGLQGYTSKTFNTLLNGPVLEMYNLTQAFIASGAVSALGGLFDWTVPLNTVFNWNTGLQWAVTENSILNGVVVQGLGNGFFSTSAWSGNTLVFQTGTVSVAESEGWVIEGGWNAQTGALMWITNRTGGIYNPSFTRISNTPSAAAGIYVEINQDSYQMAGYSLTTGQQVWTNSLNVRMADGNMPNQYDSFDFETVPDATTGVLYVWALGGDVWAVNETNGNILWSWSTYQINGPAGTESPYGIYPLWVFSDEALAGQGANTILYLSEGHEYNPPLLHGVLQLALNANTGQLVWSNLGFDDTATAVAYGVMTTFNSYDGQIYAYSQGPSKTTISAPEAGISVGTPITVTGRVTDVSPGASQSAVAKNFPNGLPCVSEASMTQFMEAVYEQQPMPHNATGVQVVLSVLDNNGNYRTIGTTTTNALGDYGYTWAPDIAGNYTVYATFPGSAGYYSSSASTFFYASSAHPTEAPTATPLTGVSSENTLVYGIAAIIIVIIIIGAILAILVTRKHP
ncbi:MAG: PQQ-binding-like beta-propeller repeat protein [Candidatus Bathyarchaeia archaeon]